MCRFVDLRFKSNLDVTHFDPPRMVKRPPSEYSVRCHDQFAPHSENTTKSEQNSRDHRCRKIAHRLDVRPEKRPSTSPIPSLKTHMHPQNSILSPEPRLAFVEQMLFAKAGVVCLTVRDLRAGKAPVATEQRWGLARLWRWSHFFRTGQVSTTKQSSRSGKQAGRWGG